MGQIILFKTKPKVTARFAGPRLIMATQLCYQQATARLQQIGQLPECFGRCGEMVQDHVHNDAIGVDLCILQRVSQDQPDVLQ